MENKGLLFIPDISGFTRFVNETEIEHSRLIIQELLELLINSNQLGLEVSEIEGDAILFYKFGESPDLKELYNQVASMFCDFHKALIAYDNHRYCFCKACNSAAGLTLKVITHYGEFAGYNVKNFNKLIGKDIIIAHQLLKNDIEQHEYWLVTNNLLQDLPPASLPQWIEWNSSAKQTESGEIPFQYAQLTELKNEISPEPLQELEPSRKTKVLTVSREYDTDIITLFHAVGDFNYRNRWQEGVKKVEEVAHYLPRIGMRCRTILDNGETVVYSSSYSYSDERIVFTETDENKKSSRHFLLEKITDNKTRLTLDLYLKKNFFNKILFNLLKKNEVKASFERSLRNVDTLVNDLKS